MLRVFGRFVCAGSLILGVAEAITVCAIIYAGAAIFSGNILDLPLALELQVAIIAIAVVLAMHSSGIYDQAALADLRQSLIRLGFVVAPIFALAVVTTGILAKNDLVRIYPYRWQWTIALTTLWFACVLGGRLAFARLQQTGALARRVAVIGGAQLLGKVLELADSRQGFIHVVGQIDPSYVLDLCQHTSSEHLKNVSYTTPHEIVVDFSAIGNLSVDGLVRCREAGISVLAFKALFERETKTVELESVDHEDLALSKGLTQGGLYDAIKRLVDIAVALFGLILFAPLMLTTALALRLESPGPILYRQERVGRNGKSFEILKFRSMYVDAEKSGIPRWAAEHDPRITPIGRIIRKVRIDELPQFFNVLRGDMSVVGPRPERPYFVDELALTLPFYRERHLARPGITGWAQVNYHYGASFEDAERKHSYDLYYLKHRSVVLDLFILLKTVRIVLFAEGSR